MQCKMEMDFHLEVKLLQTIVNSFFSKMSFDSISILLNYNKKCNLLLNLGDWFTEFVFVFPLQVILHEYE